MQSVFQGAAHAHPRTSARAVLPALDTLRGPRGGGSSRLAHPSKVAPRDAVLLYLHDALTLSGLAAH